MTMLDGVNHVAVLTADLDRFIAFYRDVFELDVVFEETTETFKTRSCERCGFLDPPG